MINIIKQNILEVESGIICQQTNCFGAIGSLAAKINLTWPQVKEKYKTLTQYYKNNSEWDLLGKVQFVEINPNLIIANLFSQYDYGTDSRKTEYSALNQCFSKINVRAISEQMPVYIPYKMGCGLAGGDWKIVSEIINRYASDIEVNICEI